MSFNPNQDHSITLPDAAELTKAYRDNNPGAILGGFFGKDAIQAILDQPDCVGIKFYYAEQNGNPTLVLCGAKADQNDQYNGLLAEHVLDHPPYNAAPNPLNS